MLRTIVRLVTGSRLQRRRLIVWWESTKLQTKTMAEPLILGLFDADCRPNVCPFIPRLTALFFAYFSSSQTASKSCEMIQAANVAK